MTQPATIIFWNCYGLPLDERLPVKLYSALQTVDPAAPFFLCLAETHLDSASCQVLQLELVRLGRSLGETFELLTVPAVRSAAQGRASGGLAVIWRPNPAHASPALVPDHSHSSPSGSSLWVSLPGSLVGTATPLHLGVGYFPPASRKASGRSPELAAFFEVATELQAHGPVFLVGDFNGHTAQASSDCPDDAALDAILHGALDQPLCRPPARVSLCQHAIDPRGDQLLALCQSSASVLLNGRFGVRSAGYTCFASDHRRGARNTVVDYALASLTAWPLVESFEVRPRSLESDHACLQLRLRPPLLAPGPALDPAVAPAPPGAPVGHPALDQLPPSRCRIRFELDQRSRAVYLSAVKDLAASFAAVLAGLEESPGPSERVNEAALCFLAGLQSCCTAAGCSLRVGVPPRRRPGTREPAPPWFTPQLRSQRPQFGQLARAVRAAEAALIETRAWPRPLLCDQAALENARQAEVARLWQAIRKARGDWRRAHTAARKAHLAASVRSWYSLLLRDPRRFWASLDRKPQPSCPCPAPVQQAYFEALLRPPAAPGPVPAAAPAPLPPRHVSAALHSPPPSPVPAAGPDLGAAAAPEPGPQRARRDGRGPQADPASRCRLCGGCQGSQTNPIVFCDSRARSGGHARCDVGCHKACLARFAPAHPFPAPNDPADWHCPLCVAPAPPPPGPPAATLSAKLSLVAPISPAEVRTALAHLQPGKAADAFGLQSEMLTDGALRLLAPPLASLFQLFFTEGFPICLSRSILLPIYKGKGDKADMNSYRGISIMPLLAKGYALVLEKRLSAFLEGEGRRSRYQFGFRGKRGTQDAIFTLRALLAGSLRPGATGPGPPNPPRRLYVAFVDFAKAFDTVDRPQLWARLTDLGVPAPFRQAVESYYSSVLFQVNTTTGLLPQLASGVGVKQGCPLSPCLFGAFIERFAEELSAAGSLPELDAPAFLQGNPLLCTLVPLLLYADDLALLSTSQEGLQRQLDRLSGFCDRSGMAVQILKTKVMVFRPSQRGRSRPEVDAPVLTYRGSPLEVVSEFRYLGFPLTSSLEQLDRLAAASLLASAQKRFQCSWALCKARHIEDMRSLLTLFDSLAGSVLHYASVVFAPHLPGSVIDWGDPTACTQDRFHQKALRIFLGLPPGHRSIPPSALVLLETGRLPVPLLWLRYISRFLCKVQQLPPTDLVALALRDGIGSEGSWISRLQRALRDLSRRFAGAPGAPFSAEDALLRSDSGMPDDGFDHLLSRLSEYTARAPWAWMQLLHRLARSQALPTTQPGFDHVFERYATLVPPLPDPPPPPRPGHPPSQTTLTVRPRAAPYLQATASRSSRGVLCGLRLLPASRGLPFSSDDLAVQPPPATPPPPACPCGVQALSFAHLVQCASPLAPWAALRHTCGLPHEPGFDPAYYLGRDYAPATCIFFRRALWRLFPPKPRLA